MSFKFIDNVTPLNENNLNRVLETANNAQSAAASAHDAISEIRIRLENLALLFYASLPVLTAQEMVYIAQDHNITAQEVMDNCAAHGHSAMDMMVRGKDIWEAM